MPKVGLSTGVERREILRKAAYYIRSETAKQISSKLIIMPRLSPPGADMLRSRGDAIRGVLEELINFHDDEIKYFEFEEIIICGNPDIMEGMDQFSFAENLKSLPIRMQNLYEEGPWEDIEIQDVNGDPTTIRVNQQIKKSKFRVSISVPSSDPAFGIYGALQNMIFAVHPADRALLQGVPQDVRLSDERAASVSASTLLPDTVRKRKHHPDRYNITYEALKKKVSPHRETDSDISLQYRTLYRNLARLAEHVMPDLAYVDGTYVVDGLDARIDGGFGLSGDDPVAVDTVLAEILGMDVSTLGHLQYMQDQHLGCADPDEISVAMGSPDDLDIEFTPHPDEQQRLDWRHVRLPDENGEAVGYIPPEAETESASEDGEETEESEPADSKQKEQTDKTGSASEESDDEGEATAEGVEQQEAESDTDADAEESEPSTDVEASDEDLSLRERVERRLIRRGKMEGDLPEGEQPEEPKETSDEEQQADGEEEESEDDGVEEVSETEEESAGESTEDVSETGDDASEQTEEQVEEKEEKQEAASTEAAEAAEDAPDDVRERVRHRLIRRGKLEGDLPDEEVEATTDETETDEKEEAESDGKDKQQAEETEEDTGEDTDAETEPKEDADGASSVRDRVQQRLANRDKLDEESAEQEEEEEADSGEPVKAGEPDQVDEVDETVEVTTSSGPSLRPSDEVTNAEDFLANLSDYEPEDKIRRRLAVRQQAVGGSTGSDQASVEEEGEKTQEESGPDTAETSDVEGDQGATEEPDEASEEEAEDSADQGDGGGYSRDPDAPLRDRVKERLAQRGKLE